MRTSIANLAGTTSIGRAEIKSLATYVPPRLLTNADLEKLVETSDEWILQRTGIRERHIVEPGVATSDIAKEAAAEAIRRAGLTPDDIDLIIVGTVTPDMLFPSTACLLQHKLGASHAWGFDVSAACSAFAYALTVGSQLIAAGSSRYALIVGADVMSSIIDYTDRTTCVLFGDGAGAVVLRAADEPGVVCTHCHADGQYEEMLHVPSGISSGYDKTREETAFITMKGSEVFRRAVGTLDSMARETLANHGFDKHDVSWLIPHQANLRIIGAAAKKVDLPMERVVVTVDEHANTSSASIPLALDVAVRDGRVKRGDLLLFEAFGAGFTWGSALVRY